MLQKLAFIFLFLPFLSFGQKALTFDDSNNYVDFGKSEAFAIAGNLTVQAKLKSTMVIDYSPLVSNLIETETLNLNGYWLGIDTSGRALFSIGCSNPGEVSYDILGTSLVDDEKWHQVSGVVNINSGTPNAMIYVDGVLENTIPIPNPIIFSTGTFSIGTDTWSYYHQGGLDDIRLWDRALTSSEVSQYLDSNLIGNENGLVALYQFGLGTGKYKEFLHVNWEGRKVMKQKLREIEKEKEQANKETERAEKLLIIVGLVAVSIIISLLFLRFRSVQMKKALLRQESLDAAKKEQEILELKVEEENKNVQLLSLELNAKKEYSRAILERIKQEEILSEKGMKAIEFFIKNELDLKSTRVQLQNRVGNIKGDFHNALKIKHPNLSDSDLNLAAMIVMRMSNKEIAISKNMTAQTIRTTKHRLKQKFGLSKDEDLSEFLNQYLS